MWDRFPIGRLIGQQPDRGTRDRLEACPTKSFFREGLDIFFGMFFAREAREFAAENVRAANLSRRIFSRFFLLRKRPFIGKDFLLIMQLSRVCRGEKKDEARRQKSGAGRRKFLASDSWRLTPKTQRSFACAYCPTENCGIGFSTLRSASASGTLSNLRHAHGRARRISSDNSDHQRRARGDMALRRIDADGSLPLRRGSRCPSGGGSCRTASRDCAKIASSAAAA